MIGGITLPDGGQAWLLTGYGEVRAALADSRLSLDKRHSRGWGGFSLPPALDANLLNMDPPAHTRIRALVAQAFTARRVESHRPKIQRVAVELLDRLADQERADLVAAYAEPLPVTIISDLLGVPLDARSEFRGWATTMLAPDTPESAARAIGSLHAFLVHLVALRRRDPGGDLLSAMIAARDRDDRLSEDELTSLAFLMLIAGFENSVNLIGNGLLALLASPEHLAAARADTSALRAVIEEVLRLHPPAPLAIRRFATRDMRLAGVHVAGGDVVMLSLAEAGRDPQRYERPTHFDPQRAGAGHPSAGHLSFGHGIHFCLGASLARLTGEVAIGTLIRGFPHLALAVPAERLRWRPSFRTRGLVELPARLRQAGT